MTWVLLILYVIGIIPSYVAFISMDDDLTKLPAFTHKGEILFYSVTWPLILFIKIVYWGMMYRGLEHDDKA